VEDVVPGSPGEEAGFRSGDVILGVGNNYSNNILVYKALMQNVGEKIRFVIMRNSQPEVLFLRPISIL
jgi:S1-C subfamily serine protease